MPNAMHSIHARIDDNLLCRCPVIRLSRILGHNGAPSPVSIGRSAARDVSDAPVTSATTDALPMSQNFLKRFIPTPEQIRRHPSLRFFQHWLHDPNLWQLNRYSVSTAVFIGLLIAFIPLPIHILLCTLVAIWWRANLPIALAIIWVSNPLTIPPQFYLAYKVGARLLNLPQQPFAFELSLHWLRSEIDFIWQPLLLGCAVCGLTAALLGTALVRINWRAQVIVRWRARQRQRRPH
jgi:uncharacterized protein (DUF2062 family)